MGRKPKRKRESYGAWLQYLRKEKGLSQDRLCLELEKKLGLYCIAHATISDWETTGKLPGREMIPALAEVLGVSIETLLRVQKTHGGYSPTQLKIKARSEIEKWEDDKK